MAVGPTQECAAKPPTALQLATAADTIAWYRRTHDLSPQEEHECQRVESILGWAAIGMEATRS